jgi:hypothetical protein
VRTDRTGWGVSGARPQPDKNTNNVRAPHSEALEKEVVIMEKLISGQ